MHFHNQFKIHSKNSSTVIHSHSHLQGKLRFRKVTIHVEPKKAMFPECLIQSDLWHSSQAGGKSAGAMPRRQDIFWARVTTHSEDERSVVLFTSISDSSCHRSESQDLAKPQRDLACGAAC